MIAFLHLERHGSEWDVFQGCTTLRRDTYTACLETTRIFAIAFARYQMDFNSQVIRKFRHNYSHEHRILANEFREIRRETTSFSTIKRQTESIDVVHSFDINSYNLIMPSSFSLARLAILGLFVWKPANS